MITFEDYYLAALGNSAICSGSADHSKLRRWFGDRHSPTREEIAAKQAEEYARAAINNYNQTKKKEDAEFDKLLKDFINPWQA